MKKIVAYFVLLQIGNGFSQVAVDAVTSAQSTGAATSLSWTHTTGGSNRLLIVSVAADAGIVSSVSYNGTALSFIDGQTAPTEPSRTELWYLLNPPVGTYSVIVTHGTSEELIGGAVTFNNVHQTTTFGTAVKSSGSASPATVNVATVSANEMVMDVVATDDATVTFGAGQTQHWNRDPLSGFTAGATSTEPGVAGTVTMSWTLSVADNWAIVAVPVKASASNCAAGPTAGTAAATTNPIAHGATAQLGITGESGGCTYQWLESTDGGTTWQIISGATTDPYTTSQLSNGTYRYKAAVTDANGCVSITNVVVLIVNNGPCGTCTRFISGATATTVLAGEVVCVKFGDTYTGTAQIDGGIFCVDGPAAPSAEGTFSGRFQSCLTFNNLDEIGCGTVNNFGTVSMAARIITMKGGVFNNSKTISFNKLILDEDVTFSTFINNSPATLTLSNTSTGLEMTGTPASSFTNAAGGTVTLTAGDVVASTGTLTNNGTMNVTGAYDLGGASTVLTNGGTLTISDGNFSLDEGTVNNSGTLSVTKALADFMIQLGAGSVNTSGTFAINDRIDMSIGGTSFTNSGTLTANNWNMSTNSTLTNNSPGTITLVTSFSETQSTNVVNGGTITTGTFFYVSQAPLDNSGIINVGTNFDLVQGPLTNTGSIHTNGYADFSQGGPHYNSGCIAVAGNFTHSQSTFNGPAVGTGRFCVGGVSTGSSGTFEGSGNLDMCDNGNPAGGWDSKSIYTDNGTHCGVSYAGCTNCAIILPVEFLSFSALWDQGVVLLNWATASETNNDYFSIEKSTDGSSFIPIGRVTGAGISSSIRNYEFTDESNQPTNQLTIYYRLKQVDFDGNFSYSPIASVLLDPKNYFTAYCNASGYMVIYFYADADNSPANISLYDMMGRLLFKVSGNYSKGIHQLVLPAESFSSGIINASIQQGNDMLSKKVPLQKIF